MEDLTPQQRAQNLITQNRQNTGQRSADLVSTEANLRADIFGKDPQLENLRSQEAAKVRQLYEHDKNVAAQYQTPPEQGQILDPYIRELQLSNRYAGTMETLTGIRAGKEKRKDILGDVLKNTMNIFNALMEDQKEERADKRQQMMDALSILKVTGGEIPADFLDELGLPAGLSFRDPQQITDDEDAKKKTADTSKLWDDLYQNATTEYDIWKAINENQDAWRAKGVDVDKLWAWHKSLVDRVGKGGNIGQGEPGLTTDDYINQIPTYDSRENALKEFEFYKDDMISSGVDINRVRAKIDEFFPPTEEELEKERQETQGTQPGGPNILKSLFGSGAAGLNLPQPGISGLPFTNPLQRLFGGGK